jgi:hypothetical protein
LVVHGGFASVLADWLFAWLFAISASIRAKGLANFLAVISVAILTLHALLALLVVQMHHV